MAKTSTSIFRKQSVTMASSAPPTKAPSVGFHLPLPRESGPWNKASPTTKPIQRLGFSWGLAFSSCITYLSRPSLAAAAKPIKWLGFSFFFTQTGNTITTASFLMSLTRLQLFHALYWMQNVHSIAELRRHSCHVWTSLFLMIRSIPLFIFRCNRNWRNWYALNLSKRYWKKMPGLRVRPVKTFEMVRIVLAIVALLGDMARN